MSSQLQRYKLLTENGLQSVADKVEAQNLKSYLEALGEKVRVFAFVSRQDGIFQTFNEVEV